MRSPALMAQDHNTQDNPSNALAKAAKQRAVTTLQPNRARGAGPVALGLLGTNAWAVSVGWTLLSADVSLLQSLLASSGLVLLWAGALLHARSHAESFRLASRWILLAGFPLSLSAALCLGDAAQRARAHSALSLLLSALALLAYGAAAVQLCRSELPLLPTISHSRKVEPPALREPSRTLRLAASAILLLGAAGIALIAPLTTDAKELEAAWGEASGAGAVLTAVVGGAIAVGIVALELGTLHKAERTRGLSARQRTNRIVTELFLAVVGAVVYFSLLS